MIPVWHVIRRTFDTHINPITLYLCECGRGDVLSGLDWTRNRESAKQFPSRKEAIDALNSMSPRQMNEYILEAETDFLVLL